MFLNRPDDSSSFLRSTAIRQTLILLCVFGLVTTIAWLATYWMVVRDTNRLVELGLDSLVENTIAAIESGNSLPETRPGHSLALLQLGDLKQGTLPPDFLLTGKSNGYHHLESIQGSGKTDFVVLIRQAAGYHIVASENVERLEETTDILLAGLQIALVTSLLATSVAGFWIARRDQARLDKISAGLARVSQGKLDTRITLPGPTDDLSLLANHIDVTTARLETTMTQMRVQTANIAHDLRTPLARLRALLEDCQTALTDRKEPVDEKVLEGALYQIDQIVGTFNALLRIARIESGEQKSSFVSFALGELVDNVVEIFGPVIEEQGQTLTVEKNSPAHITGDPDMIIQLLGNLIQNALRYGANDQEISLAVNGALMIISDQGPGIPFDERERVLQPLYQREKQRQGEGYGLGLALVSAICNLHDAKLSLTDGPTGSGLTVTVHFPKPPI